VGEYTERYYLPRATAYLQRAAAKGKIGAAITDWQRSLQQNWDPLRFGAVKVEASGDRHVFEVELYLDELNPDAVCVELYANGSRGGKPARQEMRRSRRLDGAVGGYIYTATVSATRPPADYTPRVVPCCADVAIPLENARILWQR
jgi:starch phosphorylase